MSQNGRKRKNICLREVFQFQIDTIICMFSFIQSCFPNTFLCLQQCREFRSKLLYAKISRLARFQFSARPPVNFPDFPRNNALPIVTRRCTKRDPCRHFTQAFYFPFYFLAYLHVRLSRDNDNGDDSFCRQPLHYSHSTCSKSYILSARCQRS